MEIQNYPNYLIYDDGRVYSKKTKIFMKHTLNNCNYYVVNLCKDGKQKHFLVHRLIALHYIPKVEGKDMIDHIDRNRTNNNNINNLRWVNKSENTINTGMKKNNKLGYRNICLTTSSTYKVEIQRNNKRVYYKTFKTLDEAIIKRDEFLMRLNI